MTPWNNRSRRVRGGRPTSVRRLTVPGIAALLIALTGLQAAEPDPQGEPALPDVLTLADDRQGAELFTNRFASRHAGPVRFDHAGHVAHHRGPGENCADCHHEHRAHRMEQIPACGNCHRRPDGAVDSDANMRCIECHSTPGLLLAAGTERIKSTDSGMSTELHLNGEAFHQLCFACHEQSNIANPNEWAPVSCIACHAKKPMTYEFADN